MTPMIKRPVLDTRNECVVMPSGNAFYNNFLRFVERIVVQCMLRSRSESCLRQLALYFECKHSDTKYDKAVIKQIVKILENFMHPGSLYHHTVFVMICIPLFSLLCSASNISIHYAPSDCKALHSITCHVTT